MAVDWKAQKEKLEKAVPEIQAFIENWRQNDNAFSYEMWVGDYPPQIHLLVYFHGDDRVVSLFDVCGHEAALREVSSIDTRLEKFGEELGKILMAYDLTCKTHRNGSKFQYKIWKKIGTIL